MVDQNFHSRREIVRLQSPINSGEILYIQTLLGLIFVTKRVIEQKKENLTRNIGDIRLCEQSLNIVFR